MFLGSQYCGGKVVYVWLLLKLSELGADMETINAIDHFIHASDDAE